MTGNRIKHVLFAGLPISLEYRKGDTRSGKSADGTPWSRKMYADYGYIRGTKGTDGDHADVYLGPEANAPSVFVVNQMKPPDFKRFDEQKFMLGFQDLGSARKTYLKHYPDRRFLGSIKEMSLAQFEETIMAKANHGKKVAEHLQTYAPHIRLWAEMKLAGVELKKEAFFGPFKKPAVPQKQTKKASADLTPRQGRITDNIDNAALGVLALPYAAKLVQKIPGQNWGARTARAVAQRAQRVGEHPVAELGALTALMPGVHKRIAQKVAPEPEKVSALLSPAQEAKLAHLVGQYGLDYEYMTEQEKVALMRAARIARGAQQSARVARVARVRPPAGVRPPPATPGAGAAVPPGAPPAAGAAVPAAGVPTPGAVSAGVQPPAGAAAPAKPGSAWITPGRIAKAGVLGAGALGLYGGYKAINAASGLVDAAHQHAPMDYPTVYGQGRVF
jgi:hypothetical protein